MASQIQRLDNGNVQLTVTLPWSHIHQAYQTAVDKTIAQTEIPGFRKGKAPRDMVESKLDRNHLYTQALQDLLPQKYNEATAEHQLTAIVYPQVHIEKGKEGEDWVIVFTTCEVPTVDIPELKKGVVKLEKAVESNQKLDRVLTWLVDHSRVALPQLLVDHETNHRLSQLIDNLTQLGMHTDGYLKAKKMTAGQLKDQITTAARQGLILEFVLQKVQAAQRLASRQKTLEYLTNLI